MDDSVTTATRSRAYPATDLEAAVGLLERLIERYGRESLDRKTVLDGVGYKPGSGWGARLLAALGQFDLLERRKGRYSPTTLAERVLDGEPKSIQAARLEALRKPPLYREIIDEYSGSGQIPENLPEVLVKHHGITDSAKIDVANGFVSSGVYAGLISRSGSFLQGPDPILENAGAQEPSDRGETEVTRFPSRTGGGGSPKSAAIEVVGLSSKDEEYSVIKIVVPSLLDLREIGQLTEVVKSFVAEILDESETVKVSPKKGAKILRWGR